MKHPFRIVMDTNVFVSALRSELGASNKVLSLLGTPDVEFYITVALVLEYEAVIKRSGSGIKLKLSEKEDILDFICQAGVQRNIHFLWRPTLKDPSDEMVLEAAIASDADYIVTHNVSDFLGAKQLNVKVATPGQFLLLLGGQNERD